MIGLRNIPLKYRLPLIHGGLEIIAATRNHTWPQSDAPLKAGPLVVSGFLNETLGIGRAGQMTAEGLEAAGYEVIRHDLRPAFSNILDQKAQLPGSNGGVWLIHANAPELMVALMAHNPSEWSQRYRIGYWAWETPEAPAQWARMARYLHEIWVPSRFVKDAVEAALTRLGVDNPAIRVMPHPLMGDAPAPDRAAFGLAPGVCEVLSLFDVKSSPMRKNPWASVEAWVTAFPQPSQAARLTLKAQGLDAATKAKLNALMRGRTDIRLYTERLSDADMAHFVASFDIFLSLHRSEGFGLGLLEAMAAGVPVIATDWSGNTDFLNAQNGYPVPYSLVPVRDPDGPYSQVKPSPSQVWAEPDIPEAAKILRSLSLDPALRSSKSAAACATPDRLNQVWQREAMQTLDFNRWLDSSA